MDERRRDGFERSQTNVCFGVRGVLRSHTGQTVANAIPAQIVRERGDSRAANHLDDSAGEFNIFASIDFS
jgi:hypothetical protein